MTVQGRSVCDEFPYDILSQKTDNNFHIKEVNADDVKWRRKK